MQAVDLRHVHVEHDDVGFETLIELDRFGAAAGLADHLDVHFVLEDAPEPLPHERMVVGQNHSNPRHVYATSGRLAVARHPGTRRCTMVPPPAPPSHVQFTADQLRAFAHADHSHASGRIGCRRLLRDPGAAVFHGELQVAVAAGDAHPGVWRAGVPGRIAQRLLDDAVDVDRAVLAHGIERTGGDEVGLDAGLLLELLDASLERARQAEVVEHARMQPLRSVTNAIERLLRDAADLLELGSEWRVGGRVTAQPPEQRADRGQDLPEVVVELAGERALNVLLDPQHPLRECPKLRVERFDRQEGAAIRGHDPGAQPGGDDQDHPDQHQDLAADAIVDRRGWRAPPPPGPGCWRSGTATPARRCARCCGISVPSTRRRAAGSSVRLSANISVTSCQ